MDGAGPVTSSLWIKRYAPDGPVRARLFCFPHAGGGASAFNGWRRLMPAGIELAAIQLPGREDRMDAPPLEKIEEVAAALLAEIEPLLDRPFLFYGHSLGAIIAFDLVRAMRRHDLPLPGLLAVSGRRAPQLPLSHPAHGLGDDEAFADYLRIMGATPEAILQRPHWRDKLFPTIRADLNMSDLYAYRREPPLDCPITVFAGRDDPLVSGREWHGWSVQTAAGFSLHDLPGGHFFGADAQPHIANKVLQNLNNSHVRTAKTMSGAGA